MSRGRRLVLVLALGGVAAPGLALAPPQRILIDRLLSAGLEEVGAVEASGPGSQVHGVLPGAGEMRVLLFAGCGPGARASLDAALVAVADLARTPRRHTLELVACPGGGAGPEAARAAARGWLALHPAAAERQAVLAALHLEFGAEPAGPAAVGLMRAGAGEQGRWLPPAWLAHAALKGARAGGGSLAIGDPRWPLMGQLLGRYGRLRGSSGCGPFLAAGVPALTLAGADAGAGAVARRWPGVVAGTVRRLDALAGRPRDDDVYLALGGRVWSRRDLYWAGLAVWVALVGVGMPGAWRGAGSGQRRRRGRRYLPGFLFRMLFLAALLAAPVATLVLLAPAALLTLAPLDRKWTVRLLRGMAGLPAAVLAGYWALALNSGRVAPWPAQPWRLTLVAASLALAVYLVGRRRGDRAATAIG